MKILVTGASGFVGRYLCECLGNAGHDVIALIRSSGKPVRGARLELVVPDFDNMDSISDVMVDCDAIVHLAGRAHVLNDKSPNPLAEFRHVNVWYTEKLGELAAQAKVKRFVFVSSIGVNGNQNRNSPFSERNIANPQDLYAVSKLEAEKSIKAIASRAGMEYVIVRPVLIFGPRAPGNFGSLLKLAGSGLPLPFGWLKAKRNLLSVWNMADFLRICVEHRGKLHETFLLADQQTVTVAEIFAFLAEGMKKKQSIFPFPRILLTVACILLGKKRMLDKLDCELTVSIKKATAMLGWTPPYTTKAGLIKTGAEYF